MKRISKYIRRELAEEMQAICSDLLALWSELSAQLGDDDPSTAYVDRARTLVRKAYEEMNTNHGT